MYGRPGLILGSATLGAGASTLPYTGFGLAASALVALGLLIAGLLIARAGRPDGAAATSGRRTIVWRSALGVAMATSGVLLLAFDRWWRGLEAWAAAGSIELMTSHATDSVMRTGFVILHDSATSLSVFVVTDECTVAQILGAMLLGCAPLLLVRRLTVLRIVGALAAAVVLLIAFNVLRLTAIGVAVLSGGEGAFAFAHTYLGSMVTFVGTCLAGVAFALCLVVRSQPVARPTSGTT